MTTLNGGRNVNDAGSRLVELRDGHEIIALATEDPAQLSAPSAPKRYALPADWEQHRETIRRLYLDENRTLNDVMHIMEHDYNHRGSRKQYKTKLRKWELDRKYKKRQNAQNKETKSNRHRSRAGQPSTASLVNYESQTHEADATSDNCIQGPDIEIANDAFPELADAGSLASDLYEDPSRINAANPIFQYADANVEYPDFQPLNDSNTGIELFGNLSPRVPVANLSIEHVIEDPYLNLDGNQQSKDLDDVRAGIQSPQNMNVTSTGNREHQQPSFSHRQSLAMSQAVGIRSGRSATPPLSIDEKILSLAQQHIETSFTYRIWKLDSNGTCTSINCTSDGLELPETFFDLIRSAHLLLEQGSTNEGIHVVSKAFALVKPIIKSGNVRALNFFWASLVFLVQFGHVDIVIRLMRHIYEMAKILLLPQHPVVQIFKLLNGIDVSKLEDFVHRSWQATADEFQKQLPPLHPEYIRHQCDLIFRIYGTRDAATGEQRLLQLLKSCDETPQTKELSHLTVLNAIGYNFMNSKKWAEAVNIGVKLEDRAQRADDIDLLVYKIGGMEIQARAYNELKLVEPAVKCLKQAIPLIAKEWGQDDPWRIELMTLQQKWLRENNDAMAADDIKEEIRTITESIDTD
ncbi:uncharacterized protein FFUJ_14171 [Fusarium fujikuroi IMI 58289]|uniref:Clr5 domain-containing protein n=1 Tax=Gibberella fujikuroi (strain CBS 195.34 / IMI 58289 / NRRL A-6831) TaxID=1279085 RepID=S0EMY7_GIBF5|nr:uncharacterized protein FFUJ_14171 [Fusarium fujikuroi IMI 58289]QGI71383.1 hypothetical protein CEK27_003712 [Fusarium fujikuroi]QGI88712.1 hypothetical protein CEK25_003668 [Fusarium fujikuroi]QGJ02275.1 hypothetical protein CEK26_003719 [Fusarium fujikuroi]CCT76196.1 uncharacterized protein FFUJ_14171 [Fusarium fujikuroi IMI 58289]SCO26781.1 uncharacterized protein FFM5_15050 [Fusarium fujikuroi]